MRQLRPKMNPKSPVLQVMDEAVAVPKVRALLVEAHVLAAEKMRHHTTTSAHVLAAMCRDDEGIATLVYRNFAVNFVTMLPAVQSVKQPQYFANTLEFQFTRTFVDQVLSKAKQLAVDRRYQDGRVSADHLLLAMLVVNDTEFNLMLRAVNIDREMLLQLVLQRVHRTVACRLVSR